MDKNHKRKDNQMAADSKQNKNRKRVNRIKYFIIICAVILLFTSVILNFVLMFKMMQLEEQVNQLYSYQPMIEDIIS